MIKNYIFLLSILSFTYINSSEKQVLLKKYSEREVAQLQQIQYSLYCLTNAAFVHRDSPQAIARKIERLQNRRNKILDKKEDAPVNKIKRSFEDISL